MEQWVALLRGINLGPANRVPMAALRDLCAGLGWQGVHSHIASGNLLFRAEGQAEALAAALRAALATALTVDVPVLVLPGPALRAALAGCPFEPSQGKHVHGFFCWADPAIDTARLAALRKPSESLQWQGRVVWLHAPEGVGRSDLAQRLDRVVTGTMITARNLNTLRALVAMLDTG